MTMNYGAATVEATKRRKTETKSQVKERPAMYAIEVRDIGKEFTKWETKKKSAKRLAGVED